MMEEFYSTTDSSSPSNLHTDSAGVYQYIDPNHPLIVQSNSSAQSNADELLNLDALSGPLDGKYPQLNHLQDSNADFLHDPQQFGLDSHNLLLYPTSPYIRARSPSQLSEYTDFSVQSPLNPQDDAVASLFKSADASPLLQAADAFSYDNYDSSGLVDKFDFTLADSSLSSFDPGANSVEHVYDGFVTVTPPVEDHISSTAVSGNEFVVPQLTISMDSEIPIFQNQAISKVQDETALSPPLARYRRRSHSESAVDPSSAGFNTEVSLFPSDRGRRLSATGPAPRRLSVNSLRSPSPYADLSDFASDNSEDERSRTSSRRGSSSSTREYMLGLAQTTRSGRQAPKNPSTFKCTQCDKTFTRNYNLKSHMRTHVNERPYVCIHCSKAFARQHDKKRHESLHFGVKKFACKGQLAHGMGTWGCSKEFARADALSRHFKSEAGRECIRPLIEEEARERAHNQELQIQYDHLRPYPSQYSQNSLTPSQFSEAPSFTTEQNEINWLPMVLLQQYPTLSKFMDNNTEISDNQLSASDLSDSEV
ncbi:hypothetical protein V1512DRAFT_263317 [Lipomyces arxii]|uniref:uncharacterized protein n=1 Tax=Lipomyces arxii TaxID=56418 RepID=UPI0034CDE063